MAPVPEDNRDTPPGSKDDDLEHFSNPNLIVPVGESDSSDSDESGENFETTNGYLLLPQEAEDDNSGGENIYTIDNVGDNSHHRISALTEDGAGSVSTDVLTESAQSVPEEAEALPTVSASSGSYHPAFLTKFPDGKMPSYMQVPKMPRDKDDHLWNQQRQESSKLDPVHASKILKAMSQFSLPTENIPDWARNLPDDQWRHQILNRIGVVADREKHSANTRLHEQAHSADDRTQTKDDVWVADFTEATASDK